MLQPASGEEVKHTEQLIVLDEILPARSRSTPGTGMLAMKRKMTSIASVKRILRRRSGILNALTTASSIEGSPAAFSRQRLRALRSADLAETGILQLAVDIRACDCAVVP